jgi:hypothetical protein
MVLHMAFTDPPGVLLRRLFDVVGPEGVDQGLIWPLGPVSRDAP